MENGQNGYSYGDNNSSDSRQNDSVSVDERKLFVGGIHYETGEEDLREHFGKYGEIQHIKLMTDQETGRSRGFAFIIFESKEALNNVENAGEHIINGKKVDPKKAKVRPGKIFVGRLPADLTDDDIKTHFAQFGTIVEAQMPFDKIKNQRKGFCFIVFESEQTVRNILKNPKQYIKGMEVDVKRAEPKPDQDGSMMGGGRGGRGGRGGMSGGRGGYGAQSFGGGYGQGSFGGGGGYDQGGYDSYGGGAPSRGGFGQRNFKDGPVIGGRGGRGGRGGMSGGRGGYGAQSFGGGYDQGSFGGGYDQGYDSYGGGAPSKGGFGQRYQPY